MVKGFLLEHNFLKLKERLTNIRTSPKFIESHKFPIHQEYTNEYMTAFHEYLANRRL